MILSRSLEYSMYLVVGLQKIMNMFISVVMFMTGKITTGHHRD